MLGNNRETLIRDLHNWLTITAHTLQEQNRRPNYAELAILMAKLQAQIPQVRQHVIYLQNTEVK